MPFKSEVQLKITAHSRVSKGQDSLVSRDKGTEVSSLSQDKGTTGQAQNLAKGQVGQDFDILS